MTVRAHARTTLVLPVRGKGREQGSSPQRRHRRESAGAAEDPRSLETGRRKGMPLGRRGGGGEREWPFRQGDRGIEADRDGMDAGVEVSDTHQFAADPAEERRTVS